MKKFLKRAMLVIACAIGVGTTAKPVLAAQQGQIWTMILSMLNGVNNSTNSVKKDEASLVHQFRASLLKEFGGVRPGFFDSLYPQAMDLLQKATEFVKQSDADKVEPQDFCDYVTKYLINTKSGSLQVLSRGEFNKACSTGTNKVQVSRTCFGENIEEFKENRQNVLYGNFFDTKVKGCEDINIGYFPGCSACHSVRFSTECRNFFRNDRKKLDNGSDISFDLGPKEYASVDGLIDLSNTKVITREELGRIKKVLYYEKPELFGIDNFRFTDSVEWLYYCNSSFFRLISEAFKKTFGCDLIAAFGKLNPRFADVGCDKDKALRDFMSFMSEVTCGYKPLASELEKIIENYGKKPHIENKLLAALCDDALCAKLLGYQAIFEADGPKHSWYLVVDPGCLTLCGEAPALEDKTLGELYSEDFNIFG